MTRLATENQRLIEQRALHTFASALVQETVNRITTHFRADRNARYEDQGALIQQSAREHAFHACLMACSESPTWPRFVWTLCHDHRWMDLDVPGSRFGQDNTDNAYRIACVGDEHSYRIRGRFGPVRPVDFSICVVSGQLGEGIFANTLAYLGYDELDIAEDGSFAITLDDTPTQGRRNHLCIAGGKLLLVRDTMADWAHEQPCELTIEMVGEAPFDSYQPEQAEQRAAQLAETVARFFLENLQHGVFESGPINAMNPPWSAGSAGGLVSQSSSLGHYGLSDDEALIITADPLGARYVGMQITDIWMLSYEYRDRTSSLNHAQAIRSADGLYRWVISRRDPGVANWLDGGGNGHGTILLRWHHVPGNVVPGTDSVSVQLVKLSDLRSHLPADTQWFDAEGREKQRAQRRRDYENRLR